MATFVVCNDFWCLNLVDLLLRAGVFTGIKYLYYLPIVGVLSLVVAFCAFCCSFDVCAVWFVFRIMIGRGFVSVSSGRPIRLCSNFHCLVSCCKWYCFFGCEFFRIYMC